MDIKKDMYEIGVVANPDKSGVLITVDGETHEADGFEFGAPLGTGFAVRKITRVELVPATPASRW
jgi:hypothetical protein